jgi:nitroreductase
MFNELIKRNRSYRRFHQNERISIDTLKELVNLARLSPTEANFQELKYILSNDADKNSAVFSCLKWAGFLTEWDGPAEGERPAAYIIILKDTTIMQRTGLDHGIAAQSILLGATEKGLGGCMLQSIDKDTLREVFDIDHTFEILLVIALGKPCEEILIDEIDKGESTKYWRDEKGRHHVPKRKLDDIIVETHGNYTASQQ